MPEASLDDGCARVFRICKAPATALDRFERSCNADRTLAETYVRPLERKIFARSHAGGESDCEQHVIWILCGFFQKIPRLLGIQNLNFPLRLLWEVHAQGRILRNQFPLYGLLQGGAENRMREPDRSGR